MIDVEDRGLYALNLRQQFFTLAEKGVYAIGAHSPKMAPAKSFCLVQLLHKSGFADCHLPQFCELAKAIPLRSGKALPPPA